MSRFNAGDLVIFDHDIVGGDFHVKTAKVTTDGYVNCSVLPSATFTVMAKLSPQQASDALYATCEVSERPFFNTDMESVAPYDMYLLMSPEGLIAVQGKILKVVQSTALV